MSDTADPEASLVAELFHEVVDLDRAQRLDVYVQRATSDSVRAEVESLLGEEPIAAFEVAKMDSAAQRLANSLLDDCATLDWQPGTQIGDYEIVREIARGGMGIVFEAQQLSLGRRVALKVIRDPRLAESKERIRFRAEAEAIARLEHPGIVPVFEVAEYKGQQFFSMAYLAGGSLRELVTPLDPRRAAELIADICDAIHYAHTQNLVHRDLKPANVLLTESMSPRVSDFGVAKDTSEDSDLTHTGAILGTPGFMAPEQASGKNAAVSHLADVYGLGGILYYLLSGCAPVEGSSLADTLYKVLHEEVSDVRKIVASVPADLASICRKALEKDPLRRYHSAAALAEDVRRYLNGEATEARPLRTSERLVRWCRRNPALAVSSALTLVAIVGGSVTAVSFGLDASEKAAALAKSNITLEQRNEELVTARTAAQDAQGNAEAFGTFLIEDVIRSARAIEKNSGMGTSTTVTEALIAALPKLDQRFAGRRLAAAQARHELAITFRQAGHGKIAIEQLELSLQTRRELLGVNDKKTLLTLNSLGAAYYQQNQTEKAIEVFEDLTTRAKVHAPEIYAQALTNLAANYEKAGRFADLIPVLQRALQHARKEERSILLGRMAVAHARNGNEPAARKLVTELRAELELVVNPLTYLVLRVEFEIVETLRVLKDDQALADFLPRVLDRCRKITSPSDLATVNLSRILVAAYTSLGRKREAAMEILKVSQARPNDSSVANRQNMQLGARLHLEVGSPELGRDLAARAFKLWFKAEKESPQSYAAEALLCELLLLTGEVAELRKHLGDRTESLRRHVQRTRNAQPKTLSTHTMYSEALATFEELTKQL